MELPPVISKAERFPAQGIYILQNAREKGGTVTTIEHHDQGHGRIEKRVFAALDPAYLESIIGLRQM